MNRNRFLLIYGVDPQKWARRYGIEPASAPCYYCATELTTTIPFALGNLRGLVAPACDCGSVNTPYCIVTAEPGADLLRSLADIHGAKSPIF